MKVYDILHESIDFHPATIEHKKDGTKMITPHGWRQHEQECYVCDGSGKDKWDDDKSKCQHCKGEGKYKAWGTDTEGLNVSNSNARAIIEDILGKHFDYGGMIENHELPALKRKLIQMINSSKARSSMHKDTTDNEQDRQMVRKGSASDPVAHIGHNQPRMVDMGRTDEQVMRYAQKLLDMVEFAQKNNLIISWS